MQSELEDKSDEVRTANAQMQQAQQASAVSKATFEQTAAQNEQLRAQVRGMQLQLMALSLLLPTAVQAA